MAQGELDEVSESEQSASTVDEREVYLTEPDRRGSGNTDNRTGCDKRSKYNGTASSDSQTRDATRTNSRNTNSTGYTKTNGNSNAEGTYDRGTCTEAVVRQWVKAVLLASIISTAVSLATFVASLGIADSPGGILASLLECVVAVGIFGVGLVGVLKKEPGFLALYTVFGTCMALAQTLWLVLGSYSIHQVNASLRTTRHEEQIEALKGLLRTLQAYVAAAALSIVSYSLAALCAHKLRCVYLKNPDQSDKRTQGRSANPFPSAGEAGSTRHATVAVDSPFA